MIKLDWTWASKRKLYLINLINFIEFKIVELRNCVMPYDILECSFELCKSQMFNFEIYLFSFLNLLFSDQNLKKLIQCRSFWLIYLNFTLISHCSLSRGPFGSAEPSGPCGGNILGRFYRERRPSGGQFRVSWTASARGHCGCGSQRGWDEATGCAGRGAGPEPCRARSGGGRGGWRQQPPCDSPRRRPGGSWSGWGAQSPAAHPPANGSSIRKIFSPSNFRCSFSLFQSVYQKTKARMYNFGVSFAMRSDG